MVALNLSSGYVLKFDCLEQSPFDCLEQALKKCAIFSNILCHLLVNIAEIPDIKEKSCV